MPRISTASPRASRNTRNGPSPLQTRISALLREARWILFAALAAWLTLVLATWSAADPGWSAGGPAINRFPHRFPGPHQIPRAPAPTPSPTSTK